MRYITRAAAALIFVPLFLALLFMMPLEFCISSWHLWRADATTAGRVISSQQKSHHGNSLSLIRYSYTVSGRSFESDRVRAGWISNKGYEAGGGDLAESLSAGSEVAVRYDSAHPEFALLEYGWPKWSVGFSLVVWGLLLGGHFFDLTDLRPDSHFWFGLTRGACLLGFVIIALLPPTVEPRRALPLLGAWLVFSAMAGLYGRLRYPRQS